MTTKRVAALAWCLSACRPQAVALPTSDAGMAVVAPRSSAPQMSPPVIAQLPGCAGGTVPAEALPSVTSCVVSGRGAVPDIVVKTSDGDAFVIGSYGAPVRVYIGETPKRWRVDVASVIEFSGTLERTQRLRVSHATDVGGVLTLREGAILEGAARGTAFEGSAILAQHNVAVSPVRLPCIELRLPSVQEHEHEARSDATASLGPRAKGAVTVQWRDAIVWFPTSTAMEGLRATAGFFAEAERLETSASRVRLRIRTRDADLTGWVETRDVELAREGGGGRGEGIALCGTCRRRGHDRATRVRVAAQTNVSAKANGAPWGRVRESFESWTVGDAVGGWAQLRSVPQIGEGECAEAGVQHVWVPSSAITRP